MARRKVPTLVRWGGEITGGPTQLTYIGGKVKGIFVSEGVNFTSLTEKMYDLTQWDRRVLSINIICRFGRRTGWEAIPIEDDDMTDWIFHPENNIDNTVELYLEKVERPMEVADVQKVVEKEFEMTFQDKVMEETKDKKNAVEAYVYDMRYKLHDKYQEFVTALERDEFYANLQEAEDWLHGGGEDVTKWVYVAKLEELKKLGDPIEERFKEHSARGPMIELFLHCINSYREAAISEDPTFNHIDIAEKQKVVNKCRGAEAWLMEKKRQQDSLPKHASPVLLTADVKRKAEALDRFCRPIMTKARRASTETQQTPQSTETQQPPPQATT